MGKRNNSDLAAALAAYKEAIFKNAEIVKEPPTEYAGCELNIVGDERFIEYYDDSGKTFAVLIKLEGK